MRHLIRVKLFACSAVLTLSATLGCSASDRQNAKSASTQSAATASTQTTRVPEAEQRLAEYLTASLATATAAPVKFDTLMACVPENMSDPIFALADFHVLSSQLRGDTVDASAVATTVAEETGDMKAADRRVATQRIEQDTLHWSMVRDKQGRWGVCGISKEGYDFGTNGTDRNTRWEPAGASRQTMLQLADSIRHDR